MVALDDLCCDDGLVAEAIATWSGPVADLPRLIEAAEGVVGAALAVLCGLHRVEAALPALLRLADSDDAAGRAAAWALAQLDAESALLAALAEGGLDLREHVYLALAGLAARGGGSPTLAAAMRTRIDDELARAAQGRTSLAEQALRVLAVLGASDHADLAQRLIEQDPYADRFELQRQGKQVQGEGSDRESVAQLTAPWQEQLAELLAPTQELSDEPSEPAEQQEPTSSSADTEPALAQADDADAEGTEEEPIDWQAFAGSAEAAAIDPSMRQMVLQLGPAMEQLCTRMTGLPLAALQAEEVAGLLLQILPQALPPQAVQAALSPGCLNGLEILGRWLQGQDRSGAGLIAGVRQVRAVLREQLRSSGMLGGPDYSDPPEASASEA